MKSVAVIEGWAGGPPHTKLFRAKLNEEGFAVIKQTEAANIIIAHSAGCYEIPPSAKASLILLIDPGYWPGKSLLKRLFKQNTAGVRSVALTFGYGYGLKKIFWCIFYAFAKPRTSLAGLRNYKSLDFLNRLKAKQIILVRNQADVFCTPQIGEAIKAYSNVKFKKLPGLHDDYYTNPAPYIELLQQAL